MPLPKDPIIFKALLDPAEKADFVMDHALLLDGVGGEIIDEYTLTMSAEGGALGVSILSLGGYAPSLIESGAANLLWLEVDEAFRENAAFSGEGVLVGIVCEFTTNSSPARRRKRTYAVNIRQL